MKPLLIDLKNGIQQWVDPLCGPRCSLLNRAINLFKAEVMPFIFGYKNNWLSFFVV